MTQKYSQTQTEYCPCGYQIIDNKCQRKGGCKYRPPTPKQKHYRGNSKFARDKGLFTGLKGNNA